MCALPTVERSPGRSSGQESEIPLTATGPASFEIGTTIGNDKIISVIGQDGMGKVFKIRNLLSERTEATKVLLAAMDARPELVERN